MEFAAQDARKSTINVGVDCWSIVISVKWNWILKF